VLCDDAHMKMYRVGEFASLLDVNPRTVRRWMTRGLLSYAQLPGGERRIPYEELESIVSHHQRGDSALPPARDYRT
jgi:excisionase family DNA binding protein